MRTILRVFIFFSLLWVIPAHGQKVEIDDRARAIGESLRCVVCQNQSIYESDAPLASDMRDLVKRRLEAGDSNAEVISYMRDKYGDYVLLKPPVQNNTYVLWLLPFLLLLGGLVWFLNAGATNKDDIKIQKDKS